MTASDRERLVEKMRERRRRAGPAKSADSKSVAGAPVHLVGQSAPSTEPPAVDELLDACGFASLGEKPNLKVLETALRELAARVNGADPLRRAAIREAIIQRLIGVNIGSPAKWVDAALGRSDGKSGSTAGHTIAFAAPEPWVEPVDGQQLLTGLAAWLAHYLYLPPGAADALAVWTVLTWFRNDMYFAPLLAVLSATKRCGKTLLLDLLRLVVYRGHPTSGVGVTSAVLFRLNDLHHPTLLIDEAEKLSCRHADRDLIGMLNVGYRRGARVQRCVDRSGDFEVVEFDAFGFRALAAIGSLWDTILDRAIVIHLVRKPQHAAVARFSERKVKREGMGWARRIRRWVDDNRGTVAAAEIEAPRPDWLTDRGCDNWAGPFAVASVVGGVWHDRVQKAAKLLRPDGADNADHGERLIHDVQQVFATERSPDVIKSGDLVAKLNAIETSPWGDYRNGDGISTIRLAALLAPFDVRSRQDRDPDGRVIRGYWLAELQEVFCRYPPRSGTTGTIGTTDVRGDGSRTTVPLVPSPGNTDVSGDDGPSGTADRS